PFEDLPNAVAGCATYGRRAHFQPPRNSWCKPANSKRKYWARLSLRDELALMRRSLAALRFNSRLKKAKRSSTTRSRSEFPSTRRQRDWRYAAAGRTRVQASRTPEGGCAAYLPGRIPLESGSPG